METTHNIATSAYKAYEEMTPKRQELYKAAEKLITDYRGYVGGLIAYADYNIDDNTIDRYTAQRLCTEYLDTEIGDFGTALDVITYLSEECGVWEGNRYRAKEIRRHLQHRRYLVLWKSVTTNS